MSSKEDISNQRTLADVAYQFLWGAMAGLGLALIPLALSMPMLTVWNIAATVTLAVLGGTLSAFFGKRFLQALMTFLESFPPIA